jgi:hypothetical protein
MKRKYIEEPTAQHQYVIMLEEDQSYILNRFREAVDEPDPAKRLELYEAAVEVCVITRGG